MSLTNIELQDLAKRMCVSLHRVCFKDELDEEALVYNTGYIINLENEFSEDGQLNPGSHWCCFFVKKNPKGTIEPIYFDPFGIPPPQNVLKFCKRNHIPYNTIDIQSIVQGTCGYYCLSFLYYISTYPDRTQNIYDDCEHYTEMFYDLSKSNKYQHNDQVLKLFFQSSDPKIRAQNPVKEHEMTFIPTENK
jgi:hypothetical protein